MGCFQLNSEKLKPGDVILEAGDGLTAEFIKSVDRISIFEKGKFSHVFIYLGMNLIMEADADVRRIQASRIITDNLNKFLILRHPNNPDGIQISWLGEFAGAATFIALHPEIHKSYDWRGMFGTKIPFIGSSDNAFFCSKLVAEAYKRLEIDLFLENRPRPRPRPPQYVTPNAFLSKECLLRPITTEECFSRLPDHKWISGLTKRNRYDVIKSYGIPLLQIVHELSREIVAIFGPRVDELTKRIGKTQKITSLYDLYFTLYFPDLPMPDADRVAEEITEFMQMNYPSTQIDEYIYDCKSMVEFALVSDNSSILSILAATLQRDIDASESLLLIVSREASSMDVFPPPPFKKRSIHFWIQAKLRESIQLEGNLLSWRKSMLQKISKLL